MNTTIIKNPLLKHNELPDFNNINLNTFEDDITEILTNFENDLNNFEKNLTKEITYNSIIDKVEKIYHPLNYAWSIITHLNNVNNSTELRNIYTKIQPKIIKMHDKINQSKKFLNSLKKLEKLENNPIRKRIIDKTISSLLIIQALCGA